MALEPGSVVERYVIEALLGAGGMAEVYAARHDVLDTRHAIKFLHVGSDAIQRRLLTEGRVMAKLRHPNIVAVTDVIEVGGALALVMDLVEGPSLDDLLYQRRLSIAEVDELARGILAGVAEAHRHGFVHRDLKPANVLLKPIPGGFTPKVADFGIVKALETSGDGMHATRVGVAMGTPRYMAPEQVRDARSVDPRADVFSLGAMLYEMLSGEVAFPGEDLAEVLLAVRDGKFRPLDQVKAGLPDRIVHTVHRCLAVQPRDRFDDASEVLDAWCGVPSAVPSFARNALPAEAMAKPPHTRDEALPLYARPPDLGEVTPPIFHEGDGWVASRDRPAPPAPAPDETDEAPAGLRIAGVPVWVLGVGGVLGVSLAAVAVALMLPGPQVREPAPADPEPAALEEPAPAPAPVATAPKAKAATGTLRLRSLPPADVTLDGRASGDTRSWERDVTAGWHTVQLVAMKTGQRTEARLNVVEGDKTDWCWSFDHDRPCTQDEIFVILGSTTP